MGAINCHGAHKMLTEAGFDVPEYCKKATITISLDDAVTINYQCYAQGEALKELLDRLAKAENKDK